MILDWKKIKKSITLTIIIILFITELITGLMHNASSWIFRSAKSLIFPTEFELAFTKFIIYRTALDQFPTCEMDVVIRSNSDKNLAAELKELKLFGRDLIYQFRTGQEVIKTQGKDIFSKHIVFRDKILDDALKIPQDSNTAVLELKYKYVDRKTTATVRLTDKDVAKCTYWQSPVFSSTAEAISSGVLQLHFATKIFHSDPISGKKGDFTIDVRVFTDQSGLYDFNMAELARGIFNKELSLSCYLPAFRRKYGGIYLGLLESDTARIERISFPVQFFGKLGEYDLYNLTGTTFEQNFSHVREFIYYDFDATRRNKSFEIFHKNSKYFILLIYEESKDIQLLVRNLIEKGYKVGWLENANFFEQFEEIVTLITPTDKLANLSKEFNATYIKRLNSVIRGNGIFVFFPAVPGTETTKGITNDICQLTGKDRLETFVFDCQPFESPLPNAPFSTPVFVFLNFSDKTMSSELDSVGLNYPF